MKKIIYIVSILIFTTLPALSQAQFVQGDNILSGTFNWNTQTESITQGNSVFNGPKETYFNISASGMRIINSEVGPGPLGVGLKMSFLTNILSESDGASTLTISEPTFEIAPFVRSYFSNTNNLRIFAEGVVGASFGSIVYEEQTTGGTSTATEKTSGFNIGVRPGLNYFLTDNIGLEFLIGSIGYRSVTIQQTSNSQITESDFGIRFDMSTIQVGITYKL